MVITSASKISLSQVGLTSLWVRLAGASVSWARPQAILRARDQLERLKSEMDGLVLTGGEDIHPSLYQQREQDRVSPVEFTRKSLQFRILKAMSSDLRKADYDADRDRLEFELLDTAVKKGIPVLGLCRGMQFINVYFQGTLLQDLAPYYRSQRQEYTVLPKKTVVVEPNSRLSAWLGRRLNPGSLIRVNSMHYQAVGTLGDDLRVSARERDSGVVQAIESIDKPILGVQWHPEFLAQNPSHRSLFECFVREVQRIEQSRAPSHYSAAS